MGCVYVLTSPSGKQYVGMTTREFDCRWNEHCKAAERGERSVFYNALRKYGPEAFSVEILFESDDREALADAEVAAILELGTLTRGYNMTRGGDGVLGISPEVEARRVAAIRAAAHSPERLAKVSATMKRKALDPAFRASMAAMVRASWRDPDVRARRVAALRRTLAEPSYRAERAREMRRRWQEAATRAPLEAGLRAMQTPEARAAQVASLRRRHQEPEMRKAWSLKSKKAWENPDYRAKRSAGTKALWENPDYRARKIATQVETLRRKFPSIMGDGIVYDTQADAARKLGLSVGAINLRVKSESARWAGWYKLPMEVLSEEGE